MLKVELPHVCQPQLSTVGSPCNSSNNHRSAPVCCNPCCIRKCAIRHKKADASVQLEWWDLHHIVCSRCALELLAFLQTADLPICLNIQPRSHLLHPISRSIKVCCVSWNKVIRRVSDSTLAANCLASLFTAGGLEPVLTHAAPLARLEASYLNISPFTRPHIVAPGVIIKALPAHRPQCTSRQNL